MASEDTSNIPQSPTDDLPAEQTTDVAQAAGEPVRKVVESAIANARVKADRAGEAFDPASLVVREAYVDEGPTLKRFRPRAQGRASRILKRTSHITVVVAPAPEKAAAGAAPTRKGRTR